MMVITEAAPGLVPHSAVVPGITPSRVMPQPMPVLTATTASTPTVNSGQCPRMSPAMESGTDRAIMQPITPCASTKGLSGRCTLRPPTATAMAASRAPSRTAAGACSQRSSALRPTDKVTSAAQGLKAATFQKRLRSG